MASRGLSVTDQGHASLCPATAPWRLPTQAPLRLVGCTQRGATIGGLRAPGAQRFRRGPGSPGPRSSSGTLRAAPGLWPGRGRVPRCWYRAARRGGLGYSGRLFLSFGSQLFRISQTGRLDAECLRQGEDRPHGRRMFANFEPRERDDADAGRLAEGGSPAEAKRNNRR
jgi:hypothetical protein